MNKSSNKEIIIITLTKTRIISSSIIVISNPLKFTEGYSQFFSVLLADPSLQEGFVSVQL